MRARSMRARFSARALLTALTLLSIASRGAGSLSPTLTSEDPLRLDLELNVTRAGDVTVLLWEDTHEEGVDGKPMTVVIDLQNGNPNAPSVNALRSLSANVAAAAFAEPTDWAGPGSWTRPRAALVDEVHHDPSTDVVVSSPCCSPNLTDHVRRPFMAAEPANLFLARNGTHEWDPGTSPPNLPSVNLVLGLGSEEDDSLNDGMTFSRVVALRAAVATATYSREYDVTVSYSGAGRPKHAWAPTVILHGYDASNFNADLAAGVLRREVVREAVAHALGLPGASLDVLEVADEPASERSAGEGACRFNFTVSDVVDPDEVARAWPLTDQASFLEAAKARMLSNALWELVAVSGRRGPGVTATVTAELRPNTAGSWVRVANGGGVEPRDVNAAMQGYSADEKVFVSSVAREYVLSAGQVFKPPRISKIRDAPPTPNTVLDVVHRSGSARRMTALVARFDEADVAENGYHVFRVSFHNQRPGADARVGVLDGSDGGDDPWFGRLYIMLSRPPSPPPMPAPPPKVQGLDTRVASGPAENSVSPLGTSFEFLFEPLPGCETCGVPTGTTVYARVAKEPELVYGDWEACTAVDVEAVVQVLGGLNVTRTVKRYQLTHAPEALGAYRAQAKSVDEDSFAPGVATLEDTTPVERRYIVGAIVSGAGVLDRRTGVISVTFTDPVPFGEPGAAPVAAAELLSPASRSLLGPGDARAAWANPRTLLLTLPPARESGFCAAWREVRAAALAHALRNNRPDVPVRLWTDPASVELPREMTVSWRAPESFYDAASGFQMERSIVVRIDDARNAEAGVVIAGARVSGGCQQMSLQAVAADGSWDGVARWSFDSVRVSPNAAASADAGDASAAPGVDEHPALQQIVADANAERLSSLTLDPANTRPGLRYRFGASLTDCVGLNSTASMDADRVAGAVPFVYPTSGRVKFAAPYSASITVAMETRIPDVNESVMQFGPSCDVDVTELTYIWTNLTGEADCFYTDVRSTAYAGFERAPRATRRSLVIPPFCLKPRAEPHKIELFSTFGSDPDAPASRTEVLLTVTPSPLVAAMGGGAGPRVVAKNAEGFALDASASFDPDAAAPDADPEPEPSAPSFRWSCGAVETGYAPDPADGSRDAAEMARLYAKAPVSACPAAVNEKLAEARGGPAVPDGVSGALDLDTLYRFTAQYQVGDDRVANVSTLVHAVDAPVPSVTLRAPVAKSASSVALRLVGAADAAAPRENASDASAATAVSSRVAFSWTAAPALDFANPANFLTSTDATCLVVAPNVLLPGQAYVFTLMAKREGVDAVGYASAPPVEVIGPPAVGVVAATPAAGFELDTEFFLSTQGWGGGGVLLYSMGYVARGANGEDAEVFLTRQQAATTARGTLPADAGAADGERTITRVFAYAEVPGGGGAVARAETTVTVARAPPEELARRARDALRAAALLEDVVARAAGAVAACAAMNPPARIAAPANASGVDANATAAANAARVASPEELLVRRDVRSGAMALAIESARRTLEIVDEDPTASLDPDIVAGLIVSVATVAAAPSELSPDAAASGVETVKALLRAPTARAPRARAAASAAALFDVALRVVALGGADHYDGALMGAADAEGSAGAPPATAASRVSAARRRHHRRALAQTPGETEGSPADDEVVDGENATDVPDDAVARINPLSAMALDGATVATRAIVRGRVANETIPALFQSALSVSARRVFPSDLFRDGEPVPARMDHPRAATYVFPPSVAAALATSQHADVSLYRVDGEMVPSGTRAMSDACAVDLRDDADARVAAAEEEEILARVPLLGSGLLELEKAVYQYQCARHVAGVWVADDPEVRTGDAVESAPGSGQWHVECFGRGGAFLGYLVGVVVAPIAFEAPDEDAEAAATRNAYWFLMAFTVVFALVFGACALRRGMRRYAVKVANSDNAEANKA